MHITMVAQEFVGQHGNQISCLFGACLIFCVCLNVYIITIT